MTVKELIAWLEENSTPDAIVCSSEEGSTYEIREERDLIADNGKCIIGLEGSLIAELMETKRKREKQLAKEGKTLKDSNSPKIQLYLL